MPTQRCAFHFVDEIPADPAWWRAWVESLPPALRQYERGGKLFDRVEMGERRPLVWVAAPFPDRAKGAETRRDDELESLAAMRALVELLAEHCVKTGRSVRMLRDGRGVGCVVEIGPDEALAAMFAEWQALDDARPIDEQRWWRTDHVSLWAGVVPRARFDRLLDEGDADVDDVSAGDIEAPAPITDLASALGIQFYEHGNIDSLHVDEPRPLREVVADLRARTSLLERVPAAALDRQVNCVIALYESDFSNRPHDALGEGLTFVGVFPYAYDAGHEDRFDEIEE